MKERINRIGSEKSTIYYKTALEKETFSYMFINLVANLKNYNRVEL